MATMKCYELTITPIFHPHAPLGVGRGGRRTGRGGRIARSEAEPGKKEGWWGGGLVLIFCLSYYSPFFNLQ